MQGKGGHLEWLEDVDMENVAIWGSVIGEEKRNSGLAKVSPMVYI